MRDVAACRALIAQCRYRPLGDFVLPEAAWWDHYYEPLQCRVDEVAPRHAGDGVAERILRECREEIDCYRRRSDCYGYAFFVMAA